MGWCVAGVWEVGCCKMESVMGEAYQASRLEGNVQGEEERPA